MLSIRANEKINYSGEILGSVGNYAELRCYRNLAIKGSVGSTVTINSAHDILFESSVGNYSKITCGEAKFSGTVGSKVEIESARRLIFENSVGNYSSIICAGANFAGSVGSTVTINSSQSVTFARDVGNYSKIHCAEGIFGGALGSTVTVYGAGSLTFERDLGNYCNITCGGPARFNGNLGSTVTVKSLSSIIFEKNVGAYCQIECKGAPVFKGDVSNSVKIICDGEPTFLGSVGNYVTVNGRSYSKGSSGTSSSVESKSAETVSIFTVGGASHSISIRNGRYFIGGTDITDMVTRQPENKISPSAPLPSAPPQHEENEDKDLEQAIAASLALSHAPAKTAAIALPIEEKKQSPLDAYVSKCSEYTRLYINSFKGKKKKADIVAELKLNVEESKLLEDFLDPISSEIMEIPLRLNEKVLSLETIIGLEGKDPFTRFNFVPENISPSRETNAAFEKLIKTIQDNRNNKVLVSPPGGLSIEVLDKKDEPQKEIIAPPGGLSIEISGETREPKKELIAPPGGPSIDNSSSSKTILSSIAKNQPSTPAVDIESNGKAPLDPTPPPPQGVIPAGENPTLMTPDHIAIVEAPSAERSIRPS